MDIQTKDGITLRNIPDGTPEEAIKARLATIRAERGQPAAPVAEDSFAKRVGMGALEAGLGVAQLASRPVGAIGEAVGSEYLSRVPQETDAAVGQLRQAQESGAPQGFDAGRLVGNVGALLPAGFARAPAALARVLTTGKPLAQAAKVGGAVGGSTAVLMPTTGENLAIEKGKQAALGIAGGVVLGPLASKAGQLVASGLSKVAARINPGANISVTVDALFTQSGIDPRTVSAEFRKEVESQVANALRSGAQPTANREALLNREAFDRIGAQGTKGQVTRDPSQWAEEEFIRNAPGAGGLRLNYDATRAKMSEGLQAMQAASAKALDAPQAGARVAQPLVTAKDKGQQLVSALYDDALARIGVNTPLDGPGIVSRVNANLRQTLTRGALPADIKTELRDMAAGKEPFDILRAEEVIKAMNRIEGSAKPEEVVAMGIVRKEILDAYGQLSEKAGKEAAEAFGFARKAASDRFSLMDAIPALKGAGDVSPDVFIQKFVTGPTAKRQEVAELWRFLGKADPAAREQIRGQIVYDLRKAAGFTENTPDSRFLVASFDKALESMKHGGKLGIIFTPEEVKTLDAIARVGRTMTERPGGTSGTGLGGAARLAGMVSALFDKLPIIGSTAGLVTTTAKVGGNAIKARNALQSASLVQNTGNAISPKTGNILAGGAGAAVPYAVNQ